MESQDLQPDDRVNHSDGAAMNGFVDLHGASITSVIETFDRVIFKGHLNGFFPDGAFGHYCYGGGFYSRMPVHFSKPRRNGSGIMSCRSQRRQGGRSST